MHLSESMNQLESMGETITLSKSETIHIDDPASAWFVLKGEVNVFAIPYENDQMTGKKEYLFSIDQEELVIGFNNESYAYSLVLQGNATLIQLKWPLHIKNQALHDMISTLTEAWENHWVDWQQKVRLSEWGLENDTEKIETDHGKAVQNYLDECMTREYERIQQLAERDAGTLSDSIEKLAGTMKMKKGQTKGSSGHEDVLLRTCQFIGKESGIDIEAPNTKDLSDLDAVSQVQRIGKISKIRTRQVHLSGDWWHEDSGIMLAFTKEEHPVALIPTLKNHYEMHDLGENTTKKVTAEVAEELSTTAFVFYRPLPFKKLKLWDLFFYASSTRNVKKDFIMFILLGITGGVLGLAVPIGLGNLVDDIIPEAEQGRMLDFVLVLTAIALAIFTFEITRSLAMLRMEGKLNVSLQAAVWDRVLNLPVPFFRDYSAGDLFMRVNSINAIRQSLSGVTLSTIFAGIFSLTQFILLFYYSMELALIASVLVFVAVLATILFGVFIVRNERRLVEGNGKLTGFVFQILNGVSKFRVAGAERRAFGLWTDHFTEVRKIRFKNGMITNHFEAFNVFYPTVTTIILFFSVSTILEGMPTGSFLVFFNAFSSFIASMMSMSLALVSTMNIIPMYERAKPILETVPEIDSGKEEVESLLGEISVNHLNYRYEKDGPLILNDVSIKMNPGEFVAIVGTSGSGKSTLLRLLLGFDQPSSGSIFYDDKNIDDVNVQSLRRNLGVVLQNGQILSGDIFTNIAGTSALTTDDVWEAARMAGMEEDIKSMPMGLYTMIDEGAQTISGGQKQRLLIARAIANKPHIIFFDEATSALDNRTQKIVSDSIEGLHTTRLVIAHRLSTIMHADRIYVLDKGEIVEEGSYEQLMDEKGMFYDLAKRQMA